MQFMCFMFVLHHKIQLRFYEYNIKTKKKTEHESTLYVQMSECQHGCLHTRAPVIWIHSVTLAASGFHTNTQGPILKHPLKFQTISISFCTVSDRIEAQ